MNADTIERARAAIARLRETEREATPGPWVAHRANAFGTIGGPVFQGWWDEDIAIGQAGDWGDSIGARQDTDAAAIVALRNAAPALLALAEAVAGLVDGDGWWWVHTESAPRVWCEMCQGWRDAEHGVEKIVHRGGCPVPRIDAALAALAAPGEVQP